MKVAIDARLNAYRVGGIAQYTQELLGALVDAAPDDHFTVLAHRKQERPLAVASNVAHRRLWTPPHHKLEQQALGWELRDLDAQLLHFPDFIPLLRGGRRIVITVHDLAFLRYPEILDEEARLFYGQIGRAVRRADRIIAVSEHTKRDLIELLSVPAGRIAVIYEAAAAHFRPLDIAPGTSRSFNGYSVEADLFMLFVGTLEPRKNLTTLIDAMAVCRDEGQSLPYLVVAGARGWLDSGVFDRIIAHGLQDHVQMIGGVTQAELVWLYNACRFYVNPELYSGFGLPVLEAMQCGAPVISSDAAALPEVVGDAGLLVRPLDVDAWTSVLSRLWDDDKLRIKLRASGLEQARRFSWAAAAEATLRVYREVCG